jgi:hypothetical protein
MRELLKDALRDLIREERTGPAQLSSAAPPVGPHDLPNAVKLVEKLGTILAVTPVEQARAFAMSIADICMAFIESTNTPAPEEPTPTPDQTAPAPADDEKPRTSRRRGRRRSEEPKPPEPAPTDTGEDEQPKGD